MNCTIIMILSVFPAVLLAGLCWYRDFRRWNKGISPSGKEWYYFDSCSRGDMGFTDGDGNYIWISHPFIIPKDYIEKHNFYLHHKDNK